ncbi:hypothetical protein FRB93_008017 [Tulasnella sp. JGI-2019a]|nr:hypothetical protein FRB93_008017 [Tulasnella sp. JGI-2019a]
MGTNASAPRYDPATDIPDLRGKVALVTGGNTGIGYQTVAQFVNHGAKVYMGSRTESRAAAAIAQLQAEGFLAEGKGQVEWLPIDLSTPASTKLAAEEFLKRETRLDILVHNAARTNDPEDFQLVEGKIPVSAIMATNHLGPFVLTTTLLPLIKKTAAEPGSDVRVVTLSSIAHLTSTIKVDWKTADGWDFGSKGFIHNSAAYGTTKLANVLFTKQLQKLFDAEGVDALSIAIHPGSVGTDGFKKAMTLFWFGRVIYNTVFFFSPPLSPAEGAYTSLFASTSLAISAEKRKYAGAYLVPFGEISQPSKEAQDPIAAQDLWETSERVVAGM